MKDISIKELKNTATQMRMKVIDMIYKAQSGHPGGSLSAADFVTACYFKYMNIDPKDPRWPDRDRMVLSKGHVCPIQYACLASVGFFPESELDTLRKEGSMLQGHPSMNRCPGIDISTGSLGQGLACAVGMAMAMQGSSISGIDVASVAMKVNDDGFYSLMIGASDMGTGCDTILSQMAAECLECDVDDITVVGADTDTSPYDSGSYASSTTYITGKAVEKACMTLRKRICALAAERMNVPEDETEFTGTGVVHEKSGSSMTMEEIATAAMCNNGIALEATESNCSPVSPPPYMAGAVEIELDKETGEVRILDYAAVVDCGTVINPNLARVQVEGGLVQGIGMTLFENIQYTDKGQMINNSFMQYKVPTRLDMGRLRVEFRSSYEPTGPFGAKSIGEIVINTPAPALAHAIYNATGLWFRELPITSEQIAMGIAEKECE